MYGVQADASSAGHSHTESQSFSPMGFGHIDTGFNTMEWELDDPNDNLSFGMAGAGLYSAPVETSEPSLVRVRKQRNTLLKDDDWECKRDVITSLYANMTLEKVMHEMSERYDFHASKQMYLRRIKKWGIMKNFKASEKEAVASRVSGGVRSVPVGRGRSIPMHRIVRHLKAQEKIAMYHGRSDSLQSPTQESEHNTSAMTVRDPEVTITLNQLENYLARRSMMNNALHASPPDQKLETFLWMVRDFTEILFQQKQQMPPGSTEFWVEHTRITHLFEEFGMCIVKSVATANAAERRAHIDKACSLVKHLLEQPYWLMMLALLRSFRHLWVWQPLFAITVTKFVRDMAKTLSHIPSNQHIVQILDLLLQLNNKEAHLFDMSSRVVLDTLDRLCESHIDSIAGPAMKHALSYTTNTRRNVSRDSQSFASELSDQGPIRRLYAMECIWLQILKLKEKVKRRRLTKHRTLIMYNDLNDRWQNSRRGDVEDVSEPP